VDTNSPQPSENVRGPLHNPPPLDHVEAPQPALDFVVTIGDIGITPDNRVVTPNGVGPLAGSMWIVRDNSRTEESVATWALILCVLTVIETCGLGLIFLLFKNRKTTGSVEVQVQGEKLLHVTQIYVSSPFQVTQIQQNVRQAQSLAAAA
jgi:hypothetical protein